MANNTIVDNIILGCLCTKPMSGYAIKQMITNSTAWFYNASYGSIYPTLKRHEDNGWVLCREEVDQGRYKKVYEITPAGRQIFMEWMAESPGSFVMKYDMLVRLFFYENLDYDKRAEQIKVHIEQLKAEQKALREIEPFAKNEGPFKLLTWQWGDEFYSFVIQWFEKVLAQLPISTIINDTEEGERG